MFNVQQRGTGAWTTSGAFTADRWALWLNLDSDSATVVSLSDANRAGIGDEAARYAFQNAVTGNAGAASYSALRQQIEGVRRLGNKAVTVSFWAVAASGTPQIGISLDQNFGTGGSPTATVNGVGQAVTISTTFTRYSRTFTLASTSGVTLGTNGDDATALWFWFSAGSNAATRAGNIGVQTNTFAIWGVQLEIGSVATQLEKPDPRQDLAKCQRFYCTSQVAMMGGGYAGNWFGYRVSWPVTMRAAPASITFVSPVYTNASGLTTTAPNATNAFFYAVATATAFTSFDAVFAASADL
jgi:hypothetical protein